MSILDTIKKRKSVRAYNNKSIPDKVMAKMLESLRLAPSACNFQPWKFIVVTDKNIKKKLVTAAKDQKFIAEAPVVIVGCGFPEEAYKTMGGYGNSVDIDLSIAIDHLTLAAAEEGLGTCWIGAFNEKEVKDILSIPDNVKVVVMTPLGYPQKPLKVQTGSGRRKSLKEIVVYDRF
jgi:nitroreductase